MRAYNFLESDNEWYETRNDRPLSEEEIAAFQENVVWPATNILTPGMDIFDQPLGRNELVERALVIDGKSFRFNVGSVSTDDDGEELPDDELTMSIRLTVSRHRPELTEDLCNIYAAEMIQLLTARRTAEEERRSRTMTVTEGPHAEAYGEVDTQGTQDLEIEVEAMSESLENMEAWESRIYYFNLTDPSVLRVDIYYELLDEAGESVWGFTDFQVLPKVEEQNQGAIVTEEEGEAIENVYAQSITATDIGIIRRGFARLGVNPLLLT
jgi:hypothetical protein